MVKRCVIHTISTAELKQIYDVSTSYQTIMLMLKLSPGGHYVKKLQDRFKLEGWSLDKFAKGFKKYYDNNDIFVENSKASRTVVKNRILEDDLISYVCSECGQDSAWNNKTLVLQLDHINGINNDNRLENLRFLCPNCHTQTDNYSGKSGGFGKKHCLVCGIEIYKYSTYCRKHSMFPSVAARSKISWPDDEELSKMLWDKPLIEVAKELGVSSKTLQTRCKKRNINKPHAGHWTKFRLIERNQKGQIIGVLNAESS